MKFAVCHVVGAVETLASWVPFERCRMDSGRKVTLNELKSAEEASQPGKVTSVTTADEKSLARRDR
jgi:hypothetical protein